ncbi:CRISPR/Cas system CMR subunit Cmr4, Cas7 group, RAMP superfamily [Marinitoga hydrogenitolerans DSM 16785]|uniref:CRISPR/Cas system CMR subunit Cmr4, Cas7 group, RAMP superfamily n=2 Tax=Marinitoga TaxID=160798 RepID=A0A1M5A6P9_MARH1|nr:CRISPR/Cas system CMR subunit Cmr4, Cas7 group, RAMP superfamily [Marinitoga hydrogenitolerans DSM 16785]
MKYTSNHEKLNISEKLDENKIFINGNNFNFIASNVKSEKYEFLRDELKNFLLKKKEILNDKVEIIMLEYELTKPLISSELVYIDLRYWKNGIIDDNRFPRDKYTGLFYYPASSLKGMLRDAAEYDEFYKRIENKYVESKNEYKEIYNYLFGEIKNDDDGNAGNLRVYPIFFKRTKIEHFTPLDENRTPKLPLSVEAIPEKEKFYIFLEILLKDKKYEYNDIIKELIDFLFTEIGIGSKNRLGYGRAKKIGEVSDAYKGKYENINFKLGMEDKKYGLKEIKVEFISLDNIHISSGEYKMEYIDDFVIKDKHGIPFIPSTSFKGALRNAFVNLDFKNIKEIFGNEHDNDNIKKGTVYFNDLKIKYFPVSITEYEVFYYLNNKKRDEYRVEFNSSIKITSKVIYIKKSNKKIDFNENIKINGVTIKTKKIDKDKYLVSPQDYYYLINNNMVIKHSNKIDKDSGTASGKDGNIFIYELIPRGTIFETSIIIDNGKLNIEEAEIEELFKKAFLYLSTAGIGGKKSRGSGRIVPLRFYYNSKGE